MVRRMLLRVKRSFTSIFISAMETMTEGRKEYISFWVISYTFLLDRELEKKGSISIIIITTLWAQNVNVHRWLLSLGGLFFFFFGGVFFIIKKKHQCCNPTSLIVCAKYVNRFSSPVDRCSDFSMGPITMKSTASISSSSHKFMRPGRNWWRVACQNIVTKVTTSQLHLYSYIIKQRIVMEKLLQFYKNWKVLKDFGTS